MSEQNITRLTIGKRTVIIVGTAHVSSTSVEEVKKAIAEEDPDRVCVEIDAARYRSLTQESAWKNLNITRVIRERKGFLLMANLVLASFQRRLGIDLGIKPGAEMVAAIEKAEEQNKPFSLCDREIQITLKRAWSRSGFWAKNKMLAVMVGSLFSGQKLTEEEIEELKKKSALEGMLDEIANFLPRVKEVLIDERDTYLAAKIYESEGEKIVAVVGAGHVPGIIDRLHKIEAGEADTDVSALEEVPDKTLLRKVLPWAVPVVILGLIGAGFILRGSATTISHMFKWILINGSLSAVGAAVALAHPLTIVLAFAAAPFTSLVPVIGVGILTGILEGTLKKPRVGDFENLLDDITTLKGFYRNRFTHVLLVFILSNLGSSIGTFIGGIPLVASLFK